MVQPSESAVRASPGEGRAASRKKHAVLGLKLLLGLVIIAAPALIAQSFVPGLFSVAFYGALAATFGWLSGGPKIGLAVVSALAVLGVIAILLRDYPWLQALMLLLLGVLYGYAASRGVGKAVLQLPILTPYFMMAPPPLFSSPPVINQHYLFWVVVIMLIAGGWSVLVLHFAVGSHGLTKAPVHDRRIPLVYGTLLGFFSAAVMLIGTGTGVKSHWVWVTLTIYVLADPTHLVTWKRMVGRVLGTFAGFAAVALLALVGIPDPVLQVLAYPALWLCLFLMVLKKPYWQYSLFLTISVVLMNSKEVNTLLLDAERFGFTVLGAGIAVLAAFIVNAIFHAQAQANRESIIAADQGQISA